MLVVNGRLVAVAKRVPGHVVGDGERTIEQLVDRVNADPRRGIGHEKVLTRIELDHQARRLLELAGKTPESVVEITYTGLRPGEKLFEELFHPGEALAQTPHEKLLLARFRDIDWASFQSAMEKLEDACQSYDEPAVRSLLDGLLPEFNHAAAEASESNVIPLDQAKR